ncbi:MAG: hypothetical protein [Asgard archaea virus VerdaV3]|nr:MAG: hypothetical protein [Asgard archaea virus VerdaV3]
MSDFEEKRNIGEKVVDLDRRIKALENHDIFKVWKSVRQGGKNTLASMLNLNQGINELKEEIDKLKNK